MVNVKWLKVGLVVGLPAVLVALLLLQGRGKLSLAEEPVWAAAEYKAPFHQELSIMPANPSSRNGIAANDDVMVVVWQESEDLAGGNATVQMKFKREGEASWQHRTIWSYKPPPSEQRGVEPAVALHNFVAHVVWIDQVGNLRYLAWDMTTGSGRCAKNSSITEPESCVEVPSSFDNDPKARPQVAVDASGVPHVVWVENYWDTVEAESVDYIYYDNRSDASWGADTQIATPISELGWISTENKHPVIAADDQYVYVAWAVEDEAPATSKCRDGIYFRRRNGITDSASWSPALGDEAKALSAFSAAGCSSVSPDSWPTVEVVNDKLFALWQRKGDQADYTSYMVYTYTLNYRVLNGSNVETAWLPSPVPTSTAAVLSVSIISKFADGEHDDYSGVRPALQLVQSGSVITSYVAWHGWTPPASGGGGDNPAMASVVRPQGGEDFITKDYPYQVFYASAGHTLPTLSSQWTDPITIPVRSADSIHCSPDFAVVSYDNGVHYPHFTLLRRSNADTGTKNVWYTNQDFSLDVYLPLALKNKVG